MDTSSKLAPVLQPGAIDKLGDGTDVPEALPSLGEAGRAPTLPNAVEMRSLIHRARAIV